MRPKEYFPGNITNILKIHFQKITSSGLQVTLFIISVWKLPVTAVLEKILS